jgi:crossover junction endodeoxyribonuclease RusA
MPGAVLEFTYSPPDRRKRDVQNLPHMLKAAIDGIADAMGCDDHGFRCVFPSQFSEPVPSGAVLVHIKPEERQ